VCLRWWRKIGFVGLGMWRKKMWRIGFNVGSWRLWVIEVGVGLGNHGNSVSMEIEESTECCVWICGIGVGGGNVVE